jgi:hypothetical protein
MTWRNIARKNLMGIFKLVSNEILSSFQRINMTLMKRAEGSIEKHYTPFLPIFI